MAMLDRRSINQKRQNRPSLIVRDLRSHVPADLVYEVLLRRGVFKWLAVRRRLVRLKHWLKAEEVKTYRGQQTDYVRGYRAALQMVRAELDRICHSPRWQAPDNDPAARRWLEKYERQVDEEEQDG